MPYSCPLTPCIVPDLPLLLGCPVLHASRVGSGYSWKVKIHRHSLYDALKSTADTHLVRIWRNNWSNPSIHKKSVKVNDPTLPHLCWKSRCAFRRWKEAGRPRSGLDSDERKKCKREVKAYLNKCKARQERRQIQRKDDLFQQNHPSRFRHQHRQKAACTKLFSQGSLITDTKNGQLGAFHGLLNPLSSCSIIESCVFPILLDGSENWVLNHRLLQALESFQAELGRRILKLPKFSSNYIPMLVLNWPSMCARVFVTSCRSCFVFAIGKQPPLAPKSSAILLHLMLPQ